MSESKNVPVYQSKLHWIIFLKPCLLPLLPTLISSVAGIQINMIMLFAFIGLVWLLMEVFRYQYTSLNIKSRSIELKTGFFVQQTVDLPMNRIESIDVIQSLVGTIFDYGDIIITGSGGTRQVIGPIERPLTCRRYIEQYLHADS